LFNFLGLCDVAQELLVGKGYVLAFEPSSYVKWKLRFTCMLRKTEMYVFSVLSLVLEQ